MRKLLILSALALASLIAPVSAQVSSGKVTTAAPTYTNNTAQPLSLDTSGNLRVSGSFTPPALQNVNVDEIAGVAVSNTTPGTFDVTCIAGCVAGAGVVNAEVTAAAPSYSPGNEPLTQDQSGNLRVTLTTAVPAGTNNIGDVDVLSLPAIPTGANVIGAVTQSGTWNIGTVTAVTAISNALPAGNNNIGDVDAIQSGTWTVQPGNTANTTPWLVTAVPPTTQADTLLHSVVLANTTNATSVKGSAGTLFNVSVYNNSATIAYLKLYNSASAPTCGSGTPVARYLIPGASSGGAGSNVDIAVGSEFATGIGYCVTTGIADADTGAVAASAYIVNLTYK